LIDGKSDQIHQFSVFSFQFSVFSFQLLIRTNELKTETRTCY
jgi:hypothetical protein